MDGTTPPVPAGREPDGAILVGLMVLMVEFWET